MRSMSSITGGQPGRSAVSPLFAGWLEAWLAVPSRLMFASAPVAACASELSLQFRRDGVSDSVARRGALMPSVARLIAFRQSGPVIRELLQRQQPRIDHHHAVVDV